MPLTSKIREYDEEWPRLYSATADWLRPMFGAALLDLQHVGSTAVVGLTAKPEIDVLAVVADTQAIGAWTEVLASKGFMRGGDLSPGHLFFKRNQDGVRTHKLHVCVNNHPAAMEMLRFRDHLRSSPQDRAQYAALKLALEAENSRGIGEYLERKAPFIRAILLRLGD